MAVLTSAGPLHERPESGFISVFEFPSCDLSNLADKTAALEPVTLQNRVAMLKSPHQFHDALLLSQEQIIDEVTGAKELCVIGNFSNFPINNVPTVLSARLPKFSGPKTVHEKIAWLTTSVLFGMNGNYYGMLGPVTDLAEVDMYIAAHQATRAPLVLQLENSDVFKVIDSIQSRSIDSTRFCFLNSPDSIDLLLNKTAAFLGFTCPCLESEFLTRVFPTRAIAGQAPSSMKQIAKLVPHDRLLLSSGMFLKPHLRKYGGVGIQLAQYLLESGDQTVLRTAAWNFLSFEWSPPEFRKVVQKKLWTCQVCAKEDTEDVRNYSKMGFTYCSMGCLGKHRSLGFA